MFGLTVITPWVISSMSSISRFPNVGLAGDQVEDEQREDVAPAQLAAEHVGRPPGAPAALAAALGRARGLGDGLRHRLRTALGHGPTIGAGPAAPAGPVRPRPRAELKFRRPARYRTQ